MKIIDMSTATTKTLHKSHGSCDHQNASKRATAEEERAVSLFWFRTIESNK